MKYIVHDRVVRSRLPEGPLAAHIDSFAEWADKQGYVSCSVYRRVLLGACFSQWLGKKGVRLRDVSSEHPSQYLRYRARQGRSGRDDVVRFVQTQASRLHRKRAKLMTTALRSFLQYARYRGDITLDLPAAVPPVANWSMASIPRAIPADQVRQLLASIQRHTAMGRRDYAILLLLARLGLRSGEVAFLQLDDIDWNVGRLSVHGKNGRSELPLSAELGKALAAYLQRGRHVNASSRVFLRGKAVM